MKEHLISSPYYAYMLRFWPECHEAEQSQWRFALVDPKTGKQIGFSSLEALFNHLSFLTEHSFLPIEQAT
ncbi:MAG: hypothetical protein Fur0022_32950 [Anaerolineales bacterium]